MSLWNTSRIARHFSDPDDPLIIVSFAVVVGYRLAFAISLARRHAYCASILICSRTGAQEQLRRCVTKSPDSASSIGRRSCSRNVPLGHCCLRMDPHQWGTVAETTPFEHACSNAAFWNLDAAPYSSHGKNGRACLAPRAP